jgi:tyrosine-protein phosphatase SIW14
MNFSTKTRSGWGTWREIFALAAIACVAVATTCVLLAQQTATDGASSAAEVHPIAQKSVVAGIQNFGIVSPNLLRGAQPTTEGFEQLSKKGVTMVVDLRDDGGHERAEVMKLGMQYVSIPWHCYDPHDDAVAQFLTLLRDNADKKIFVHCRQGTDRTGMMIAAYRMTQQGWTAQEARKEMEAFGFSFEHQMICPGLAGYERDFPHDFSTNPAFEKLRPGAPSSSSAPATPQN